MVVSRPSGFLGAPIPCSRLHVLSESGCVSLFLTWFPWQEDGHPVLAEVGVHACGVLQDLWQFMAEVGPFLRTHYPSLSGYAGPAGQVAPGLFAAESPVSCATNTAGRYRMS